MLGCIGPFLCLVEMKLDVPGVLGTLGAYLYRHGEVGCLKHLVKRIAAYAGRLTRCPDNRPIRCAQGRLGRRWGGEPAASCPYVHSVAHVNLPAARSKAIVISGVL